MRRRNEKFPDNGFEAWGGYMNAKISKLENQFDSRAGNEDDQISNLFSGVSIYVNGYTIPSAEELKTLMSKHGGVYHTYQRSDDYIIAVNLPDTKVKKMSLIKVVKPEWITESIASNRLLDYRDYLLYRNSRTQPQLNFGKTNSFHDTDKTQEQLVSKDSSIKLEQVATNAISEEHELTGDPRSHISKSKIEKYNQAEQIKTAADPNFISEFYNNSRLHHISQMGACFKQYVNDLRESTNFVFEARNQLKMMSTAMSGPSLSPVYFEKGKSIMHIDMDCFFVSVGLRNRPDLRGKPVAVTHSKGGQTRSKRPGVDRNAEFNLYREKHAKNLGKALGNSEHEVEFESRVDNIGDEDDKYGSMSEIASCSYEARAKGITNGMFMGAALRLCPDLQTIQYDFEGYKEVAYTLYNTIAQYTLDIEAVSCDEMYVDCTELLKDINISVQDFASILRNEIKNKTGCPCSTGFGGNRLQARLATKRAKPDGQFFMTENVVEDFMFSIKLRDLPGVGRQISQKLESLGHETCGSLQSMSLAALKCHLGNKTGAQLFDQCRGRDQNPLTFHTVRKSVSAEVNYGIRFENEQQCLEFLKQLSAEVHSRMQQFKVLAKCITLKLMIRAENAPIETAKFMGHGFCDVSNKSTTLCNATNDVDVITKEVILLSKKQNIDPKELRGVGIQLTKLEQINSRQIKGAMSKFLSMNNKSAKVSKHVDRNESNNPQINTKTNFAEENIKSNLSPKKPITAESPNKKSPTLGHAKSPVKRRGRPSKSLKVQNSVNNNVMSKFLHGQSVVRDSPYRNPMIKKENSTVIEVKELSSLNHNSNNNAQALIGMSWEKVRELLRAWLESGQTPVPCDIDMITVYMREMVVNKNIDKLNILLNFLRRRIIEMECKEWIEVFNGLVEEVQNTMLAVYGKRLDFRPI